MQTQVVRPKLEDENWRKRARQFKLTSTTTQNIEKAARRMRPPVSASSLVEALCLSEGLAKAKDYIDEKAAENGGHFPAGERRHGEDKKKKTYTLSNYANTALDTWSFKLRESKAEMIECAVRGGGLADAIAFLQQRKS